MEFLDRQQAFNIAKHKNIIGFGAGIIGAQTVKFLDGLISCFIDNDNKKVDNCWDGDLPIHSIDYLTGKNLDSFIILICSEQYKVINNQLHNLFPGIVTFRSPLLKQWDVFDKLNSGATKTLLVSSYGVAGGLYLVDCIESTYRLLIKGNFRGILEVGKNLLVTDEKGTLFEINSLDPFDCSIFGKIPDIFQAHGMAFWPKNNEILIADSYQDKIVFVDAEHCSVKKTVFLSEKGKLNKKGHSAGVHHINDLCINGEKLFFTVVSRNGFFQDRQYDGAVMGFNLLGNNHIETIFDKCLFPHSLQVIDGKICLLESMTGRVILEDRSCLLQLTGFLRGMDWKNNILYVGQARNRRLDDARKYLNGVSMDSGVFLADTIDKVFRFIQLPPMCDVYDVLVVQKMNELEKWMSKGNVVIFHGHHGLYHRKYHWFPTHLIYLASYCHNAGFDVTILDENSFLYNETKALKHLRDALVCGVSSTTGNQILRGIEFAKKVRKIRPDLPLVWGGPHVSALPVESLKSSWVDIVCTGRGELSILTLAQAAADKAGYHNVPGIYYNAGGRIIRNPDKLVPKLKVSPPSPYEIVDLRGYLNPETMAFNYQTAIGCPGHCNFCYWYGQHPWDPKPLDLVMEELSYFVEKRNVNSIYIDDPDFFINKSFVNDFLDRLEKVR